MSCMLIGKLIHSYMRILKQYIKTEFKNCEKGVLRDIANAKKLYYIRIFNSYKRDMKKTWRTINKTLTRNKQGSELPSIFFHDDKELTNLTEIANAFNVYFANIGKNLAADIESSISTDQSYTQYLLNPTKKSVYLDVRPKMRLLKQLTTWKINEALGMMGYRIKF